MGFGFPCQTKAFCSPEVADFETTVRSQKQILRLKVKMRYARLM